MCPAPCRRSAYCEFTHTVVTLCSVASISDIAIVRYPSLAACCANNLLLHAFHDIHLHCLFASRNSASIQGDHSTLATTSTTSPTEYCSVKDLLTIVWTRSRREDLALNNDLRSMERPAKRQKLSQDPSPILPSRTIDLQSFQRPQNRRRNGGKIILPRIPDVTVTASVLEVAVNDGSSATEIAAPTVAVALTYSGLGTVTIPAIISSSDSASISGQSSSNSSRSDTSSSTTTIAGVTSAFTNRNSTITTASTDNTVTVTATSTLRITYSNGSFLPVSITDKSRPTGSSSDDDYDSDSSSGASSSFNFNQLDSTYTDGQASMTAAGSAFNNVAVGATSTNTGSQPTSSSVNGSGSAPPVLTPQQTKVVGGVVGGIAGIAMFLIVMLYLLRWYRERLKRQGRLPHQLTSSHTSRDFGVSGLVGCAAPMSQSRTAFFPPAAIAATGSKKWRPGSDMTTFTSTTSTTVESEKSFQRISGRKIPSVLSTGGDQYGGSYGVFEKETGASHTKTSPINPFISDAERAYSHSHSPGQIPSSPHRPPSRSAPATPNFPAAFTSDSTRSLRSPSNPSSRPFGLDEFQTALGRNTNKPDGVAVFHNSPARTPVMQSPNTSTLRIPNQASVTMDADIPEMPLPSPGLNGEFQNIGVAIGTGVGVGMGERRLVNARWSARSGAGSGRFTEDI